MHFSQGWVQFGYRFSNDFAPFALVLVALGASRLGRLWPFVVLVVASIVVNFWGTMWGVSLAGEIVVSSFRAASAGVPRGRLGDLVTPA